MSVWRKRCSQLVLTAGLVTVASASAGIPIDLQLGHCVARLNDPELQIRTAETDLLASDVKYTLQQIESLLKDNELPAEVRLRLLPIARAKFEDQPRAALGVRFNRMGNVATLIESVMVNFPASGVLQPGDEIIAVEGINVTAPISPDLRQDGLNGNGKVFINGQFVGNGQGNFFGQATPIRPHIIGQDPGSTIRVKIIRHGEAFLRNRAMINGPGGVRVMEPISINAPAADTVELDVPLGRYSDLHDQQGLSPQSVEQAWQLRVITKRLIPEHELLASGLRATEFGSAELSDANRAKELTSRARQGTVVPIVAGGEPRLEEAQPPLADNGNSTTTFNGNIADQRWPAGPNVGFEIRIGNDGKLPIMLPNGLPNELLNGLPGANLLPELNLGNDLANRQIAIVRRLMQAETAAAELLLKLNIIDANTPPQLQAQKQQAIERQRIANDFAKRRAEIEKLTAQLLGIGK